MVRFSGFRIRKTSKFYNSKSKNRRFKRYINKKRNAKAQQNQIRILNKKINKVYNATKQEIKTLQKQENYTMQVSTAPSYVGNYIGSNPNDATNDEIIGNYRRQVYLNIRFLFNSLSTDLTKAYMSRIIILQNRIELRQGGSPIEALAPSPSLFLDGYSTGTGESSNFNLFCRFKEGINSKYKILYDKFVLIPDNRDSKLIKFNTKYLMGIKSNEEDERKRNLGYIYYYVFYPKGTSTVDVCTLSVDYQLGYIDN